MHEADLVVCVGARFDDRVTGKLAEFCPQARKIHIDIDPANINKVVKVDVPMVGDCGAVLEALLRDAGARWLGAASAWRLGGSASKAGARGAAWTSRRAPMRSCRSS